MKENNTMKRILSLIFVLIMVLSLAACGGNNTTTGGQQGPKELNLSETYAAITKDANMPEMMPLDSELLLDLYGIRSEYCKQCVVYICVNSLRADEIWLLEATDAASMATLKQLAQSRLDQKDAESANYDMEQNAIIKAAQVIETGNYLVVIVSPEAAAIAAAFRTEAGI